MRGSQYRFTHSLAFTRHDLFFIFIIRKLSHMLDTNKAKGHLGARRSAIAQQMCSCTGFGRWRLGVRRSDISMQGVAGLSGDAVA